MLYDDCQFGLFTVLERLSLCSSSRSSPTQKPASAMDIFEEMENGHGVYLDLSYGAPAWSLLLQHWESSIDGRQRLSNCDCHPQPNSPRNLRVREIEAARRRIGCHYHQLRAVGSPSCASEQWWLRAAIWGGCGRAACGGGRGASLLTPHVHRR